MKHDALRLWLAGVGLALLEIGCTLVRGGALFLSIEERALYAVASLGGISACVLALGLLLRAASTSAAARWSLAVCVAVGASSIAWLLTAGRRVHDAAWRTPAVVLVALLTVTLLGSGLSRLTRVREARRLLPPLLACALAVVCLTLDVLVLPRGYPAFHFALFLGALASASIAGLACWLEIGARARSLGVLAVLVVGLAPLVLARLAAHPTASFAVRESAPWVSDLLAGMDRARPPTPPPAAHAATESETAPATRAGVDLRDRDVLLISVDALRADLLRVYGGHGRTPVLDALADESAVFMRAYTPAPHTSYALASLLTGKFVEPLVTLGGTLGDPPTLPDRLRRYGYRTAAFYPPAIFFVDGARFEALAQRGFGFEYRKEMFASADERIAQLSAYLDEAEPARPLFVWMHLFEPHEPYDPPAASAHVDSERGRYEAEVAVCDRAIATMIARFRAARPRATVIITADHGEEFGDHGGSFHGSTLYDEQVRVPLLWSSPGAVVARRIDAPVELVDVGTTLLSTAGIPRDAHMRGDDLGPLLAGATDAGPTRAFASLDDRHMVTDGRMKAICDVGEPHCALFDLARDPGERRNLSGLEPALAARFRGELDVFLSSIPSREALTVSAGVGMPEILARARLGVQVHASELAPLLNDARAPVRAEAARQLGELGDASALAALQRLRDHDADARACGEATLATLRLGDEGAKPATVALLDDRHARDLRQRAGLALAARGHADGLPVLAALARDESATESERRAAIEALARLRTRAAVAPLAVALQSVRLRVAAAHALGEVGGVEAREILTAQLRDERYPPARRAEAEALCGLGAPRTAEMIAHFLGMESGLPGGLRLLGQLGALAQYGVLVADARVRRGAWSCSEETGCAPDAQAALVLPSARSLRGPVRVVVWYRGAAPGAALVVDGTRFMLSAADDQLSLLRPSAAAVRRLSLSREGQVGVAAVAVVAARPEIPPPAPKPWDAGVPADASAR